MTTHEGRAVDYAADMLAAIEQISTYVAGMDAAGFLASRLVQDAVIWNILIIGEAAGNVMRKCPKFAAEQPDIPWRAAYDTRNRVAHGYDSINMKIVWSIIVDELPMLGAKLRALLAQPGR